MQEVDAERRIQVLRGLRTDAPPEPAALDEQAGGRRGNQDGGGRERKRRRLEGEDATDMEIRLAQERNAAVPAKSQALVKSSRGSDAPLTDRNGHINLFPMEGSRHHAPKNAEAEAEAAKKKKEFEDQYTMRFSNAAGFKQAVGQKVWYQSTGGGGEVDAEDTVTTKDVWGNEDPRRREREKMRMAADDPLAIIQQGVLGVREAERERKKWKAEKDRELKELIDLERRKNRRSRRSDGDDELEGFTLDDPVRSDHRMRREDRTQELRFRHRHRNRSNSQDHSRHRSHRHGHRSGSPPPVREDFNDRNRTKRKKHSLPVLVDGDSLSIADDRSLDKLHKERNDRERVERARANALLATSNGDSKPAWEKGSGGRYSNQFAHV